MRMIVRFKILLIIVIVAQWDVFYSVYIAFLCFDSPYSQQREKHKE
jgi:hypothetical protein